MSILKNNILIEVLNKYALKINYKPPFHFGVTVIQTDDKCCKFINLKKKII